MVKKVWGLLLLLSFFFFTPTTQAQWWKGKNRKNEKSPPQRNAPAQRKPETKPELKKKNFSQPQLSATTIKERYRIDVLIPLYLDEVVQSGKSIYAHKIADKSVAGLNFYEGIKLAVEDMANSSYQADVYIHDIGSQPITQLINQHKLDGTDLLIGAVQGNDINVLAAFAHAKKINFVSAFSPSDADIVNNAYFTLLQPTLKTHLHHLHEAIQKKHRQRQTIPLLTRPHVGLDKLASEQLRQNNPGLYSIVAFANQPDVPTLASYLDSNKVNPIAIAIMDRIASDELLRFLNDVFPNYEFEVFGMPSWKALRSYKKEDAYSNIAINYTAPFYFDHSTGAGRHVVGLYKKIFNSTRPSDLVFRGYETLKWYTYLLHKYGTIFNHSFRDNASASFTRFDLQEAKNDAGNFLYYENKNLYIYRYKNGSFIVE